MCRALQSQERFPLAPAVLKLQPQVMTPRPGHRGETRGDWWYQAVLETGGVPASASTGWVGPAHFPGAPSPLLIPEPGLGGVVQVHPLESRPGSSLGNWRWGGTEASGAARDPAARLPLNHPP